VKSPHPPLLLAALAASSLLACAGDRGELLLPPPSLDPSAWTLVWADEFEGPGLDLTKWKAELGTGAWGWGNNELECYTARPENLAVEAAPAGATGSVLRIRALREAYGGAAYSSARIKTQGLFSFRYGRAEARIRLPRGQGLWPAFWMLGDSIATRGWPACGEVDILEMRGGLDDASVSATLHWQDAGGSHQYAPPGKATLASGVFADDWHVFGVLWDESSILWYLDGAVYYRASILEAEREEFRSGPFFLILNLAVGGNFVLGHEPGADFAGADLLVDWVRVYRRS